MVATYRAAAKFVEKTRDFFPGMIYTNVSAVGATTLAEELTLLGPRYADGVIVTQVVPAVSGYSSIVLEYKNALAKYFPGEAPDYRSSGLGRSSIPRSWSTSWRTRAISTWALEPRSTSAAANTRLRTRYGARRLMKAGSTRQSSSNNIGHRPGTGNCGTEDVLPSNKKRQPDRRL